jgi:MFS family permease
VFVPALWDALHSLLYSGANFRPDFNYKRWMQQVDKAARGVWWWVPSLYFAQGLPYVAVMTMSVVFYKNMGISNTDIALYTSWLYLPFVIKPLWSPFVDMFRTKRWWIITMQLLVGSIFALVALVIPMASYFQLTLAFFWLLAFSAATHDIASDGFYMLSLKQHQQAAYVGARSMFFRLSMLTGQGALVFLAGKLTELTGNTGFAWSVVFFVLAAMFLSLFVYHRLVLPVPAADRAVVSERNSCRSSGSSWPRRTSPGCSCSCSCTGLVSPNWSSWRRPSCLIPTPRGDWGFLPLMSASSMAASAWWL